ncbi:hypothetical protein [Cellulomonas alba]|uniref:Uncharacterized protein n=1 Tax=Cellulomonas alba TaxID=3053467 RepID=A0ABT7SGH9_9CELL|nr:hypothetical protein [Cellulomonas alba]MDM7854624.1 hypothetical protein [Cellulomonas alba]
MIAERPPLRGVLLYRALGRRPDRRHDGWLRADLDSRWYPVRDSVTYMPLMAAISVGIVWLGGWAWPAAVAGFVVGAGSGVVGAARGRARLRAKFFPEDEPPEIGHFQPYRGADAVSPVASSTGASDPWPSAGGARRRR